MRDSIGTELVILGMAAMAAAGCARDDPAVAYSTDVKPILDRACLACHQDGEAGYAATGLSVETYDALMTGTRFGPVVLPGDADSSVLVQLIEGRADPSIRMPHGEKPLYQGEKEKIRMWVAQGALDN